MHTCLEAGMHSRSLAMRVGVLRSDPVVGIMSGPTFGRSVAPQLAGRSVTARSPDALPALHGKRALGLAPVLDAARSLKSFRDMLGFRSISVSRVSHWAIPAAALVMLGRGSQARIQLADQRALPMGTTTTLVPAASNSVDLVKTNMMDIVTTYHVCGLLAKLGVEFHVSLHSGTAHVQTASKDLARARRLLRHEAAQPRCPIRLTGATPWYALPCLGGWRAIRAGAQWRTAIVRAAVSNAARQAMHRVGSTDVLRRYPYARRIRYRVRAYLHCEGRGQFGVRTRTAHELEATLARGRPDEGQSVTFLFQVMPDGRVAEWPQHGRR